MIALALLACRLVMGNGEMPTAIQAKCVHLRVRPLVYESQVSRWSELLE
jgi:hypothetical protein